MKSKFQLDVDPSVPAQPAATLIDPEAYDASEQQFAASVEGKLARPRFIVDDQEVGTGESLEVNVPGPSIRVGDEKSVLSQEPDEQETISSRAKAGEDAAGNSEAATLASSPSSEVAESQDSGSWRNEVAARVSHYKARRQPRVPRYPSLQLKFDPPEIPRDSPSGASRSTQSPRSRRLAVAMQERVTAPEIPLSQLRTDAASDRLAFAEAGAKILEFPRSASTPLPLLDELAEPVMDRPRILEAPELVPPPPALGGILIEPAEETAAERRPGFELPLQAAPMSRRLFAGAADSLLVISAFAVFAYIFFRVTSVIPPPQQILELSVALIAGFWIAYQYLVLVYTGTTPGLKLAKLRLSRFDGASVPKKIRRWRVLASVLSGLSLTLGYAWCFLDEDRLCWHDRITRTYMAPEAMPEKLNSSL